MSRILLSETKTVLSELRRRHAQVSKQYKTLEKYTNSTLTTSTPRKKAKAYFYLSKKGKKDRQYLGDEMNPTVRHIQEARYYKEYLQLLERDIELLEALDTGFVIPDCSAIFSRIPKTYKNPDLNLFLPVSNEASEWKTRMEEEKKRYDSYRPQDLIHMAADGTMMRSKSEVIIANYLLSLGITFVYEMPLVHHGKRINPDFTILSPIDNRTVIIIEHQGAMDSDQYQTKFIRTILFYLQTKLVPNKDVFFTFNQLDGNLDLRQIDSILHIAFSFGEGHAM